VRVVRIRLDFFSRHSHSPLSTGVALAIPVGLLGYGGYFVYGRIWPDAADKEPASAEETPAAPDATPPADTGE